MSDLLSIWSLCDHGGRRTVGEHAEHRSGRSTVKMTSCLVSETTKTDGELTVDVLSTSSLSSSWRGLRILRQDRTTDDSASLARSLTRDWPLDPLRVRGGSDEGLASSSDGRSYTEVLRLESLYPRRSPDIEDDIDDGDLGQWTPPCAAQSTSITRCRASSTWLSVVETSLRFSSSSSSSEHSPLSSMCTHTGTTFPSRRGSRVPPSFPVSSLDAVTPSFRSASFGLRQAGVNKPALFMFVHPFQINNSRASPLSLQFTCSASAATNKLYCGHFKTRYGICHAGWLY